MAEHTIGLIGCGVMGQNLALNFERHGYPVVVYEADAQKLKNYLAGQAAGRRITGVATLPELAATLAAPRRILLMVPAGQAVDECIAQLLPLLDADDILIDGGNSNYLDTNRRAARFAQRGLRYVGAGISGGEAGALRGPAIMPGGTPAAWADVKDMLQAIAARTSAGTPCCDWVGPAGAGHFVKMIHNGIEYADMQLICEAYHLLREVLGLSVAEARAVFEAWNQGELESYLIEITGRILGQRTADGQPVIEQILDTAGQKGTGRWTALAALELGQPVTVIAEAVFARCLSALQEERVAAAAVLKARGGAESQAEPISAAELRQALYAAKVISYAQGFQLLRAAGKMYDWDLDCGRIASLWQAGCIIRASILQPIRRAFERDPGLPSLLLDPFFVEIFAAAQPAWRRVVATAVQAGVPVPAMSAALAYYDGYRNPRLPAHLLQAQRDYFGAHMYERIDRPRGEFFHTDWT
ncbi:MAG: decarboxylating NADP(+)-dependent phosphogluconate dehydrogenase [Planctomycetes bacterium]|nr:decarboxylating NADP(+)-dependent phosphogluconate dehydrogenase [Planctomycetota bacterium]